MSKNCDVSVIIPLYGQFGGITKPDSVTIDCKTYVFINSSFLSYETENRTKKSLKQFSHYCFE